MFGGNRGPMTAQIHEVLILDGEELGMAFCPPLPENEPRLVEISIEEYRTRDRPKHDSVGSTANWRGYVGTWEIRDGRFYLRAVRGLRELRGDEPVFADWFTGVLRVPRGKQLEYVHMGFGTVYEREIHIRVEAGVVIDSTEKDNRNKKHDARFLGWRNLPGWENQFEGDGNPDALARPNWFARIMRGLRQ